MPDAIVTDKWKSRTRRIIPNEQLKTGDLQGGLEVLAVPTQEGHF
jgi:hypothetical protein